MTTLITIIATLSTYLIITASASPSLLEWLTELKVLSHPPSTPVKYQKTRYQGTRYQGTRYQGTRYQGTKHQGTKCTCGIEGNRRIVGGAVVPVILVTIIISLITSFCEARKVPVDCCCGRLEFSWAWWVCSDPHSL